MIRSSEEYENNLYKIREQLELKQKDMANSLGVSRRTYCDWENNTKFIPIKHLNDFCNIYDVSMDYVLNLTDGKVYEDIKENNIIDRLSVGNKIKIIRKKNNLTVRELSKILNTTPSTISAYENGKTLMLTAFAYQICKKYKISLDWLCGRKKKMNLEWYF